MKNFTGGKVAKGEQLQGLVELPKKLDSVRDRSR
jgi:hypothetical protein